MSEEKDLENVNEFGEIEAFKGTKYWFKRDLQTIKRSFVSTIKFSPIVFLTTLAFSALMTLFDNPKINFYVAISYTVILFPIFLLGYLMFNVMVTKGYDIDPYAGTHIKTTKHANRFSVTHILRSDMTGRRKALHLLRLAIYILLVVGLLLNIFYSLR